MARWFVDRPRWKGVTSVSLRRSLPEAQFVGCPDWEVTGCTNDHNDLEPGQLFVASSDAHAFVAEALRRGAAGVVVERYCAEAGRLQAIVFDARAAHARISHALAGHPADRLITLGVAGSSGKTISSLMIRSIIDAAGERCGLVGLFGFCDGAVTRCLGTGFDEQAISELTGWRLHGGRTPVTPRTFDSHLLAPGPVGLASLLAQMVEARCQAAVLEMSGNAGAGHSFAGIAFDGAVVTDIARPYAYPEQLGLDSRRNVAKLFRQLKPGGLAVINADDPRAEILGGINLDARRVAFAMGLRHQRRTTTDVWARVVRLDASGTLLELNGFDRKVIVHIPLVGLRAACCAVAAATLAWALEIDEAAIVTGLENLEAVAGHLEKLEEGQEFDVRIDAAQTPQALGEALAALRAITAGQVHCVMSAEGETEYAHRRQLAEVAELAADRVILTVSNPRNEDPNQILDDLLAGFRLPGRVRVELDRRTAIEQALADARPGDAVLIAGKGRNGYQIFADRVVVFHDDVVVRQWLRSKSNRVAQWSA